MLNATPRTFVGPTTFRVAGMTCGHCERTVALRISRVDGVRTVAVQLRTSTVTVVADRPIDRADIAFAIEEAGYDLRP